MALHRKTASAAGSVSRLRLAAGAAAIAACMPYAALKVSWLLGSSAGSTSAAAAAEMHDGRHTVGNVATLGMEVVAVLLALALTHPRGRRLPAPVVLAPIWLATGLLAPVALGLPLGIVGQAIAGGSPAPAETGLQGWVYAIVYGGFAVQAAALAVAFVLHARDRWPVLFERGAGGLPAPRPRTLWLAGAAAATLYGVANLAWAVAGDALAAPEGFDTVAQRSLLVSTGLLAFAGALGVRRRGRAGLLADRPWVAVALAWLGSATCFASGFAQYGLAADGATSATTAFVLAVGTLGGVALAAAALAGGPGERHDRSRRARPAIMGGSTPPRRASARRRTRRAASPRSSLRRARPPAPP